MTDDAIFGKWVYCNQHRRPHITGWCTISNRDKLGLGVETEQEAYAKCRQFGLPIYGEDASPNIIKEFAILASVERAVDSFDNDGWDIGAPITEKKYGVMYGLMQAFNEYTKKCPPLHVG